MTSASERHTHRILVKKYDRALERICSRLGVNPDEISYIGDSQAYKTLVDVKMPIEIDKLAKDAEKALRALKRNVQRRDKDKCIACDSENSLVLHHVRPLIDHHGYWEREIARSRLKIDVQHPYTPRVFQILRSSGTQRAYAIDLLGEELSRSGKSSLSPEDVREIKKDWDERNSMQNLVTLCSRCHKLLHVTGGGRVISYRNETERQKLLLAYRKRDEEIDREKERIRTKIKDYLESLY